jgi:hypothetical protein
MKALAFAFELIVRMVLIAAVLTMIAEQRRPRLARLPARRH